MINGLFCSGGVCNRPCEGHGFQLGNEILQMLPGSGVNGRCNTGTGILEPSLWGNKTVTSRNLRLCNGLDSSLTFQHFLTLHILEIKAFRLCAERMDVKMSSRVNMCWMATSKYQPRSKRLSFSSSVMDNNNSQCNNFQWEGRVIIVNSNYDFQHVGAFFDISPSRGTFYQIYFSHLKNAAGDCPDQMHSQPCPKHSGEGWCLGMMYESEISDCSKSRILLTFQVDILCRRNILYIWLLFFILILIFYISIFFIFFVSVAC